jgi:hypothetical protein
VKDAGLGKSPIAAVSIPTLRHFIAQLEQWRAVLPAALHWRDDVPPDFSSQDAYQVYPTQEVPGNFMFSSNLEESRGRFPYAADVLVASLRSRYYYCRYLLHRPFVFKVLHYPDSLTQDDVQGAAECLKASLKWPIAMSPPAVHKQILPLSFFWTQNLFGILVLLHLSEQHPMLLHVRTSFCGPRFDFDARETVELYVNWLRDMQKVDVVAERCWLQVQALYGLDE